MTSINPVEVYPYLIPKDSNITLIGINGKAHVGKSTVSNYIREYINKDVEIFAFADPLKWCVARAFGICIEECYETDLKEKINEFWGITPREALQFIGTEFFRNSVNKILRNRVGNDFWVKRLYGTLTGDLEDCSGYIKRYENSVIIIEDVRFQNEVEFINQNRGYTLQIIRDEGDKYGVGIPGHASENQDLSFSENHHKIFNVGSLNDLQAVTIEYLKSINLFL